jgi:hypothetical protein
LSAARDFVRSELSTAIGVAVGIHAAALIGLAFSGRAAPRADIGDDNVKPVVDEDLPALKLGGPKDPARLPDMWRAPTPVARHEAVAQPSPHASATPEAIPTTKVSDAGAPPPDAEVAKQVDQVIAPPPDAAPPPNVPGEGAADGVKNGTETDPLKAHAVSQYRARLDAWFSGRFPIRGKVPFDELSHLRASVRVTVSDARTVTGFSITKPSGNATFDEQLRASLASIQASGAELPPPPPMYPDVLGTTLSLSFACTNRSLCE